MRCFSAGSISSSAGAASAGFFDGASAICCAQACFGMRSVYARARFSVRVCCLFFLSALFAVKSATCKTSLRLLLSFAVTVLFGCFVT
jgi:hypothetical protein